MKNILLPFLLATTLCCQAAPIIPEEAEDHIGENASVRGLVEQVSFSKKGHAFLNFGGRYPQQVFTGFVGATAYARSIPHQDARVKFEAETGKLLDNKRSAKEAQFTLTQLDS